MTAFADTNWLEALYFVPDKTDVAAVKRTALAERWMRKCTGRLVISQFILLEAKNVFIRVSGKVHPIEWERLQGDLGRRLVLLPFQWEPLRDKTFELFEKLSHQLNIGTFDSTLLASILTSGASQLLSFDENLKIAASAYRIPVFPPLSSDARSRLRSLKL